MSGVGRGVRGLLGQRRRRAVVHEGAVVGHVALAFRVFPEEGHFVAECLDLAVSSFGDSPQEALDAGVDATMLYLRTVTELGEVGRIFAERDIKVHQGPYPDALDVVPRHLEVRPQEHATVKLLGVPDGVGVG